MKTIKNYLFLSFLSFFTINLISKDIEEIIVKGDWREAKLLEEDSSLAVSYTHLTLPTIYSV